MTYFSGMDIAIRRKILESNMAALKKRTAEVRRRDTDLVARQRQLRLWYLQVMSGDVTTEEEDVTQKTSPRKVKLTKSTSNVAEYRRDVTTRNGGNVDEDFGHMRMLSSKYAERRALMATPKETRKKTNISRHIHSKSAPSSRSCVDHVLVRSQKDEGVNKLCDKPLHYGRPTMCRKIQVERLHHSSEHGESKRLGSRCDIVRVTPCKDGTSITRSSLRMEPRERTNNIKLQRFHSVRSVPIEQDADRRCVHRLPATTSDSNPGISPLYVKRLTSSEAVQCSWC